jgi:hypothetical protein
MITNRRRFIQLGAMTMLAEPGCCQALHFMLPSTPHQPTPSQLTVAFQGLYLIEEKPSSMAMAIHLIDGPAVGIPEHVPQLSALASTIDKTGTAQPAKIVQVAGDEVWIWGLTGVDVTTPPPDSGGNDLAPLGVSAEDTSDIPTTAAGWNSRARLADLSLCCGATKITKPDALASSIILTHGQVDVLKPEDIGARAVWKVANPSGTQLMKRALSNRIRYSCPTNGKQLVIRVGNKPIVFKASGAEVLVRNLPRKHNECMDCMPNMNHFPALDRVVDKQFDPVITLASFVPQPGQDVGTDYCPGGRI